MAINSVMFTVKKKFQKDGHEIGVGDYTGQEITRPDVNSPGGVKTSYILHAVVPVQQDIAVVTAGVNLDVSDLVASGDVDVN
ncbi:hypothetical protein Rleg2_2434 [Rhizobium leguminosarum bv. trifolii WSM2304]|uniref:Uncharacterized protein n=1 Tax=Rhizobium leguminosarum bv. trifolii (strain WSM2304) TaxID=395492 RepID=A0ABF7QNI2_RHILW|nr:hypothetical protein [Rhizobium leguminosarum]ACI55708.1 hypothetical protein Rleg2_2434 [Rhizobium leguminosarum bv. trifolii WSM2304]